MPKKLTIDQMKEIVHSHDGLCISEVYINNSTKLKWQCKYGHVWEAIPSNIKKGHWCPYCAGQGRVTINDLQKIASERGGKCLSNKIVSSKSKLKWECSEGHVWHSTASGIKSGSWCPVCSWGLSERICRKFFEGIFHKTFPKSYPKWLINSAGNQLELDGYCKELRIAFEHHGEQHFSPIGFYEKISDWEKQQKNDIEKRELCKANNVLLVEVPQIGYRVKIDKLIEFILFSIKKEKRFDKFLINSPSTINYYDAYLPSSKELFEELKAKAINRGGRCLSSQYKGAHTKLKWICKQGHIWETAPTYIQQGKWCPQCSYELRANNLRSDIGAMDVLARKRNGICLSTEYKTAISKLTWRCSKGHVWEARPNDIQQGKWCPICELEKRSNGLKATMDKALENVKRNGGICLTSEFVPPRYYGLWRCAQGHEWNARLHSVANGNWCRKCKNLIKNNT